LANFSPPFGTPKALANFSPWFGTPKALANFSPWFGTPKALANFSPVVRAQREPWDQTCNDHQTLKALGMCGTNPFRVSTGILLCIPVVVAALQPLG